MGFLLPPLKLANAVFVRFHTLLGRPSLEEDDAADDELDEEEEDDDDELEEELEDENEDELTGGDIVIITPIL